MRWLCYLLALFFLCMDLEVCKDEVTPVQAGLALIVQGQDFQHSKDACPPLCQCECCNIQVDVVHSLIIRPAVSNIIPILNTFLTEETRTRPLNVWQPPKLSSRA